MTIKDTTVKRVIEICKQQEVTYNALATMSKIRPSALYSFLDSKRKYVGLVMLKKICDGLEISLKDFFDDALFDNLDQEIK